MPENKVNIELLKILNENIKNPFLAVSAEGNIISFNKQAADLLLLKGNEANIYDFFNEDTSIELSKLIEEVLFRKKPLIKNMTFTLIKGRDLKSQVTISEFNQTVLFITLKPSEHNIRLNEITKLRIKQEELSSLINDEEIEAVINIIKDTFPFTMLGKEKIRNEIDRIEEFIWIKNSNGIFILVNKSLASNLGVGSAQLEGRSQEELIPEYLREVYNALLNYINHTHNLIIFEGIPLQGLSAIRDFQTIEMPLTDSEGSLTAIIGICRKVDKIDKFKKEEKNILENIPVPVAILDNEGIIKHSSKDFCKLFSDEFPDFRNLSYINIFPLEISDRIRKFLNSAAESDEFQVNISKKNDWKDRQFRVLIKRNYGESRQAEDFSILLEDISPFVDLERVIKSRGKMYEVLIQNNPEPIFIYDKENLHFIEVNQAALNLYGYRKDEFLQMDLTDLYTPEDIQTLLDTSTGGIKEGVFTGPYRHKRKNGESVFVEISKISFKFNNKDAHFNVIKDVSRNLDTEKQNQLFKAAFDNASNLIFTTDSSGFIKSVNYVALNLLGIEEKSLLNSSFASIVKDEDRGTINSTVFTNMKNEVITLNTDLKKANGELLNVEVIASPIRNYKNEIESFVIVVKTLIKETEPVETQVKEIIVEKIVEKNVELSEKIDPSFLSGIFHEILTPINAMLGFVQELTESIEKLTPDQIEARDIIDQNRRRLLSTMNSVIEYTRLAQEKISPEIKNVSITEIVDETQEEISDILKNKGIEFAYGKISSSLNFKTDSQKFISLITLIFKIASQSTSTKKIYFSAYPLNEDNFLVAIQDNYSSMSPSFSENFENIFNKRKVQKDYGVSKLSINLARNLIDLLGGKFVDKSKKTSGFLFPLELKFEVPENERIEPIPEKEKHRTKTGITEASVEEENKYSGVEESEPDIDEIKKAVREEPEIEGEEPEEISVIQRDTQNKNIKKPVRVREESKQKSHIDLSQLSCLYIEDQVDSQILFKVQLKELQEIKFAVSFEEALPYLDSNHFDFIVLDINLQGEYNGLDALKIIHRMPGYETIPILAVTAYVLPGDREKFIAAGFNDFISKPIFREKMVSSLEKIFYLMHS